MVGSSLIRTGKPTSWSIFHRAYKAAGIPESTDRTYTPALDHPPLFSLLIGGWAVAIGERDLHHLTWSRLRVPMIGVALLSLWATWRFAGLLFGARVARFTLLAMTFMPSHIVTSRIIAVEHVTGLFLILGMDTLYRMVEHSDGPTRTRRRRWGLLGLSLAAPLLTLSFVLLSAAPIDQYGWYKYALYPFISIGLGFLFDALWRERLFALVLFLPLLAMTVEASGSVLGGVQQRRYLMMAFYALAILPLLNRTRWLRPRNVAMALLAGLFGLQAWWATSVLGYWT